MATLAEAAIATAVPRLSLAPSTLDLLGVELEIARAGGPRFPAAQGDRSCRREPQSGEPTPTCSIDCPPSLNLLTINALVAADAVLVPLQCEFFALEGLAQLSDGRAGARQRSTRKLAIHGVVLTMFDRRNNLCRPGRRRCPRHMGDKVYETVIPRNVRVSEAPSHGKPVLLYDPLLRQSGLHPARRRGHPARAAAARRMRSEPITLICDQGA